MQGHCDMQALLLDAAPASEDLSGLDGAAAGSGSSSGNATYPPAKSTSRAGRGGPGRPPKVYILLIGILERPRWVIESR